MNRREFVQKTLHAAIVATFAGLAGCQADNKAGAPSGGTGAAAGTAGTGSLPGTTAPTAGTAAPVQVPAGALNVKNFGAKGDGVTNDTDAFYAASQAINKAGGGALYIPAGTYIVGKQTYAGPKTTYLCYISSPIIDIENCPNPVTIIGDPGTVLRAPDGLKYGSFDPATGNPYTPPSMPFYNNAYMAEGPGVMINLNKNADVTAANLELDGNINGLVLGGQWGDTGWQLPAIGIRGLNNNKVSVSNVHTHHHAQDGVEFGYYNITASSAPTPVVLDSVVSEYNARQGLPERDVALGALHRRHSARADPRHAGE